MDSLCLSWTVCDCLSHSVSVTENLFSLINTFLTISVQNLDGIYMVLGKIVHEIWICPRAVLAPPATLWSPDGKGGFVVWWWCCVSVLIQLRIVRLSGHLLSHHSWVQETADLWCPGEPYYTEEQSAQSDDAQIARPLFMRWNKLLIYYIYVSKI